MKPVYIVIGVIVLIVLMMGGCYNSMNTARVQVDNKWAAVQSSYQRRMDLIPNLVNTVKGAANFEQTTLTQVMEARAKATSLNINASDLTPEKLQAIQQSQGQISSALGRLIAVAENYPQLKATEAYRDLMAQLEGTENRINFSRNEFNDAVQNYNVKVTNFPGNMFAGIFGFKQRPMFQADQGAEKAPKVQF
jgi:LemA protein